MDEEDVLGWEKAKKVDEDMLNIGRVNALNESGKSKTKKKKKMIHLLKDLYKMIKKVLLRKRQISLD